ncbi:MAG TPA: M20/M25/M40 family metallo-hydrolase [Solirubrobacteraceae bacterium]|nr:M20/M25/M40 family metallo-hydrolase [Solirubrobacteraceae bacterium]
MRPASEVERRRLNETFAALCAIPSPSGRERAMADRVTAELRALGLEVHEDDAGAEIGADAGNLLTRVPGRSQDSVLLCAHLDTVPHDGPIEPVLVDGGWESAGETILGADNKAAVAMLLELARRTAIEGSPVGIELLFTVSEERALAGAKAFDVGVLRSPFGYVFDHASPIGEIVAASPTYMRWEAVFAGQAAHAGIHPEEGRSAILAAARAIAAIPQGRIDDETTVNVARIHGGVAGTNVVPEHCRVVGEARSLSDAALEEVMADIVDALHEAANDPECSCDLDVTVERLFDGYRRKTSSPPVQAAEAALRERGYAPRRILSGGAADANAFEAAGFTCVNLANGTERAHQPTERVSQAALEGMLDVTYALLAELGAG